MAADVSTDTKSGNGKEVSSDRPAFFLVKLSHPDLHRRPVFRSISEKRARTWLQNRYPRGSEAYLELPDGTTEHFEAERQGENGMDADQWAPFDPDSFVPTNQMAPPGESEWADKEG